MGLFNSLFGGFGFGFGSGLGHKVAEEVIEVVTKNNGEKASQPTRNSHQESIKAGNVATSEPSVSAAEKTQKN